MTEDQLEAMRAGKERAQQRRREEAARRVSAYQAWLRRHASALGARHHGPDAYSRWQQVSREMPEIPSDHDYRLVRGGRAASFPDGRE